MSTNKSNKNSNSPKKANLISGLKIKEYVSAHGLTAEDIGKKLNINKRTYFYKVSGDTEFTATEFVLLLNLFGCEAKDLIKGEDELTPEDIEAIKSVLN